MPASFFESVKNFQRECGAVGGFVFAASKARDGIMDRHLFDKWLTFAEKAAGLPKLDGGSLARLPPEMGNGAEAPSASRRRSSRWVEGREYTARSVSTGGRGFRTRGDDRDAQVAGARRGVEPRPKLDRSTASKKHRSSKSLRCLALRIGTAGFEPATP